MKEHPHNLRTIKNDNRALVLNYIRKNPTSRAEISKKSHMSKSAVTMIINDLIDEGQIIEIGEGESSYGRKSILLDIVADYRFAIGIALHRKHTYVCVTDLKSNILAYSNYQTSQWDDPYKLLDFTYSEATKFLDELNIPIEKCIGIGVSSPGPLDYIKGTILNPPDFELFHGINIGEYLNKKSGLPVTVDNNAVLLAMQEYISNEYDYKNLMFIAIDGGIGSAIVTNGSIYRGFGGFAGEFGHISIHPNGIECSCGNVGCLEKYISMKALQAKFGFYSYEKMVDNAYIGDKNSRNILEYIADEFSCALTTAINLFDLEGVVIFGQFSYRSEMLRTLIQKNINNRSVITRTHSVTISFSQMSPDESVASVCAAIINRYFQQKL